MGYCLFLSSLPSGIKYIISLTLYAVCFVLCCRSRSSRSQFWECRQSSAFVTWWCHLCRCPAHKHQRLAGPQHRDPETRGSRGHLPKRWNLPAGLQHSKYNEAHCHLRNLQYVTITILHAVASVHLVYLCYSVYIKTVIKLDSIIYHHLLQNFYRTQHITGRDPQRPLNHKHVL